METRQQEEAYEVDEIPIADTGAHPRTVMVLFGDAHIALRTVEGPGWADDAAGRAESKVVGGPLWVNDFRNLEPLLVVEVLYIVSIIATEALLDIFNS